MQACVWCSGLNSLGLAMHSQNNEDPLARGLTAPRDSHYGQEYCGSGSRPVCDPQHCTGVWMCLKNNKTKVIVQNVGENKTKSDLPDLHVLTSSCCC